MAIADIMYNDQLYISLFLIFILLLSPVIAIVVAKYLRRKCEELLFDDDHSYGCFP
jgi:multisubunit Na+/H+ antiporter MnhF subunit